MSPTKKDPGVGNTAETVTCPWCSATVPGTAVTCPSCGASLRDSADGDVAGVTQIDPMAMARVRRIKPRGRITSWLTGDGTVDEETGGTVEPPSDEVRREMLRLEVAALDAEIEAKRQQAIAQRDLPLDDKPEATSG
ncbi:MAG TPA: hypothetical protein VGM49_05030 [Candidatus Limnocylindrales bacterium]|jgi:hypothetical protein